MHRLHQQSLIPWSSATRDRGILDEESITDEQLEAALKDAKDKALSKETNLKSRALSDRSVREGGHHRSGSRKLTSDNKKNCLVS